MDQNLSKGQIRLDISYHEIKSTGQKDRKCVIVNNLLRDPGEFEDIN